MTNKPKAVANKKTNKTIFVAMLGCGFAVWALVKTYQLEADLEDQVIRYATVVDDGGNRIRQTIETMQSETDSQSRKLAEIKQFYSDSARSQNVQLQEISFLKSRQINHDKQINQLDSELQMLKRKNTQLKNELDRLNR